MFACEVDNQRNGTFLVYFAHVFLKVEYLGLVLLVGVFPVAVQIASCQISCVVSVLDSVHVGEGEEMEIVYLFQRVKLHVLEQVLHHTLDYEGT
jgi:hypothetical protein